jgi:RNA polymerase sigma-70 factor (ECF subfamily)
MLAQHSEVARLYSREADGLRRHLQRKLGDHDFAEDLLQDAYLRMLSLPMDHAILRSPKAFLFTVASNLAVDSLRREQRQHRLLAGLPDREICIDGEEVDLVCPRPAVDEQVDAECRLAAVMSALESLPPKCRSAFCMHKFQELSYAEVARHLDVTVSMVEKYLSRALQHLRQYPELFEQ